MDKYNINLSAFIIIASLFSLSAYAEEKNIDLIKNKTVLVEENASKVAKVTELKIIQKDGGTNVSGKVVLLSKNKPKRHRAIPGHVDISIVDEKGEIKKIASVEYKKISVKSNYANFKYRSEKIPKPGTKVIIAHNDKTHEHGH